MLAGDGNARYYNAEGMGKKKGRCYSGICCSKSASCSRAVEVFLFSLIRFQSGVCLGFLCLKSKLNHQCVRETEGAFLFFLSLTENGREE